jgi:glycolate oxidase iron-sulfur subunit
MNEADEARLLACVHCGFCLSVCPTYTRLGDEADSPRGRLHLMRAAVEGRIETTDPAYATHIGRCLGCRACEPVCPSGVEYGYLLERARAAQVLDGGGGLASSLLLGVYGGRRRAAIASLPARLLRAGGLAGGLARRLPVRLARLRLMLAMLAASAPTSHVRLSARARARAQEGPIGSTVGRIESRSGRAAAGSGPRVALLEGCVQRGLFGRVNRATERVLRYHGCDVVPVRGQRCCGALHAHAGRLDQALSLARSNVAAFEASGADYVIMNAAGCGAMMKEYGEQLEQDGAWHARAEAVGRRVRDWSEFLVELGVRTGAPLPMRVAYDAPCHLHHAQNITEAPLRVLNAIPALELVALANAEECCGGAGIYGLLHVELGGRILADKVAAVQAARPDVVVTGNPGCIMQIGAGLVLGGEDVPVMHPLELLDLSLAAG